MANAASTIHKTYEFLTASIMGSLNCQKTMPCIQKQWHTRRIPFWDRFWCAL
jgi:hypothetical protein